MEVIAENVLGPLVVTTVVNKLPADPPHVQLNEIGDEKLFSWSVQFVL